MFLLYKINFDEQTNEFDKLLQFLKHVLNFKQPNEPQD